MNIKKCTICGMEYEENEKLNIDESSKIDVCESCMDKLKVYGEERGSEKLKNLAKSMSSNRLYRPHILKKELDRYVIGQEDTKKKIAVEVCNHYKRMNLDSDMEMEAEIPKNNILLLGPSGSGKTYILEVLSKILQVPLVIGDATSLTENGYVGKDVDTLLSQLIDMADGDIETAEKGIIYIDEIDKLANRGDGESTKKVGQSGVQASLLKIIDGMDYCFEKTGEVINTRNILFVCGGAFEGMTDIIEKRICKKSSIGFLKEDTITKTEKSKLLHQVTTDDLIEYGLITEFIGRLHLVTTLDELTEKDLEKILVEPKNSIIKQYETLFKLDGIKIKFEKEVLSYISEVAKKKGTGARGLKSVISDKLDNLIYDISEKEEYPNEIVITKDFFIK